MTLMQYDELFNKADHKVAQLIHSLEVVSSYFPSAAEKIPLSMIKSGFTKYKGVITSLDLVSHRYLLDYYETTFWQTFILLIKTLENEKESKLNELTFRLLLEMGVDESYILFDPSVNVDERKKYTLLKLLADYSSIETVMQPLFNDWFTKLLADEQSFIDKNFTPNEKALLELLKQNIDKTHESEYTQALIKIRRLCMSIRDNIVRDHAKLGHIQISVAYRRMKSGEAHTLHGNVFLLQHHLKQQSRSNHLFRVYMYVLFSGIEALKRACTHIANPELTKIIDPILVELNDFKNTLALEWSANSKGDTKPEV